MSETQNSVWLKSFQGSAWIGDVILIVCAVYMLFSGNSPFHIGKIDSKDAIVQFLMVITVIPWYGGYLLHHFSVFPKAFRIMLQWIFGFIILSLIVYLIIFMFPVIENNPEDPYSVFLLGFGMFFMVLGPMMLIAGYADAPFMDTPLGTGQKVPLPMVTLGMFILILAILFMILIIGAFDSSWSGDASFLVVILGFLGGPLVAVLISLPFIMLGKYVQRIDTRQLSVRFFRFIIPATFFLTLVSWHELVLFKTVADWGSGQAESSAVFYTLLLSGILPFRVLMLLKPPFSIIGLISGFIAIALYLMAMANAVK